jgi:two-component system OmpR family sensor kinase
MRVTSSSLYTRMALYISAALAAFVLIGAASLASIAAWELRGYIETRQSSLGIQAAEVLASGGKAALLSWLQNDAEIPADVSVYILDETSQDLLGRKLPDQYTDFIDEFVTGHPTAPDSNFRNVRLAPQLIDADGSTYAFLVLPKSISLWGSPATAIGLLAAAILVIASVAWLIARAFSRPINELQLAVRELASGDIRARVPAAIAERGDELGALAADFNSMARQLTELIEGRENLLREMSHELRSPLARLQAAIALAAERNSLEQGERKRIDLEIGRMNRVIGEILHYSSLEASAAPKRKLVRIDKLLQELVAVEEIEATDKGCSLKLNTDSDLAVVGDPELLQSGFENILRNAIRYAPKDSVVSLSARPPDFLANFVFKISDRGPGVAAEHLQNIFEPYFRVSSGNHDQDSTGLGLAIVKRVFERHAGQVSARNRYGGGLSVVVHLPGAELS